MSDSDPTFDRYGKAYDEALGPGIRLTGSTKEEYARLRIDLLRRCGPLRADATASILDYGCGTGTHIGFLMQAFPKATLDAVDVSEVCLQAARQRFLPNPRLRIRCELPRDRTYELIFLHGVVHHVPRESRRAVLGALVPLCAKYMVVSENNPYHPLMRLAMKLAPMDAEAEPISPAACRRLLRTVGLEVSSALYLFHLPPKLLRLLRGLDRRLVGLPLGSQYMLWATPAGSGYGTI